MPALRPIPINTKGHSRLGRYWIGFTSTRQWRVLEDWFYVLPNGVRIIVPKGFLFDGASVPRFLWWLLSPVDLLLIPGLVHDYAYRHDKLLEVQGKGTYINYKAKSGHKYWDKLFKDVCLQVNGSFFSFYLAWITLVLFGGFAWRSNRKKEIMEKEKQMGSMDEVKIEILRFIDGHKFPVVMTHDELADSFLREYKHDNNDAIVRLKGDRFKEKVEDQLREYLTIKHDNLTVNEVCKADTKRLLSPQ